jgi:hypothetical protein
VAGGGYDSSAASMRVGLIEYYPHSREPVSSYVKRRTTSNHVADEKSGEHLHLARNLSFRVQSLKASRIRDQFDYEESQDVLVLSEDAAVWLGAGTY